jgi:ATP-dependent DNA ligase
VLSHARTSRNSTPYKLTVLDDEIVCLDDSGKPQFRNLLFHRGNQCFFPFDLLTLDGKDWRTEPLADRKEQLRRWMKKAEPPFRALRRGSRTEHLVQNPQSRILADAGARRIV